MAMKKITLNELRSLVKEIITEEQVSQQQNVQQTAQQPNVQQVAQQVYAKWKPLKYEIDVFMNSLLHPPLRGLKDADYNGVGILTKALEKAQLDIERYLQAKSK